MDRIPELPSRPKLSAEQLKYREELQELEQRSQESFDKTLTSLAGGALGVSFAFVEKFTVAGEARSLALLGSAWGLWVLSLALVLTSHYFSVRAHRRAVDDLDQRIDTPGRAGGVWDTLLIWLNPAAGLAFLTGAVIAGVFVIHNL